MADLLAGKIGVAELAQDKGLSPGMLHRWRREAVERWRQQAERDEPPADLQAQVQQLRSKLAERDLELDFFAQALGKLDRPGAK